MAHDDSGQRPDAELPEGDLPEGVVDAAPATGWESANVADGQTRERSRAEAAEAGLQEDAATGYEAEAVGDIETAEVTEGIDPDLSTRGEDDLS